MGSLTAGTGVVDISPRKPLFLVGYPDVPRTSTGIHDPLLASALYLHNGLSGMVLVSLDLLFLSLPLCRALRQRIADACGVPLAAVCIACTHTHSAPVTVDYLVFRDDPVVPPADPEYLAQVEQGILAAVQAARAAARPAACGWISAGGAGVGGNRHAADGPADPEVPILVVRDRTTGQLLALALTHAMHPTVLHEDSTVVSGDYPGLCRRYLQRVFGEQVAVLHLTGTSGDQSPRRHARANTLAEAKRLGELLAHGIAARVQFLGTWETEPLLAAHAEEVPLMRRTLPAQAVASERLQRLRADYDGLRAAKAPAAEVRSAECAVFGGRELLTLARLQEDGTLDRELAAYRTAPVQVLRVGSGAFATLPGEWFVAYGLEIKRRSPLLTAVVTLANGELQGYMVTREAEGGSTYEAGMALFAAASGERMRDRVCELLALDPVAVAPAPAAPVQPSAAGGFAVDFARPTGRIRPLHGVNNGPQCLGGLIDLSPWHQRLAIPSVRLHDCEWPADYCVDVHTIVRDFAADPDDPASYDFACTDDYIAKIVALGSRIVYRLGSRIEHTPRRRHIHPPADFARWARFCVGIVRHYNEGWADGHRWNIRHWEIWNEPDGVSCWSGRYDEFIRLYEVTARAIRSACPGVEIGGPAYTYQNEDHTLLRRFLAACRDRKLPLDFFSWHTYLGKDLAVICRRARDMRSLLDEYGFHKATSHLNEWNCHPEGNWSDLPAFAASLGGNRGGSGLAACLAYFQDLPIDEAFIYTADTMVYGLFTREGAPQKNYRAVEAFTGMLAAPRRVTANGGDSTCGLAVLAGLAEDSAMARVLLVNYVGSGRGSFPVRLAGLPWPGPSRLRLRRVDAQESLDRVEERELPAGISAWEQALPEGTVLLLEITPQAAP